MANIETFYLIDYENVNSDGLEGCSELERTDHIIIFFTQNAKKLDMCDIAKHGDAEIKMYEVPSGKQSADMHISSYVGYLIGICSAYSCSIVIVSKDTDYDNVIKFWKKESEIKISRRNQIKEIKENKQSEKKKEKKKASANSNEVTKASEDINSNLNKEVIRVIRNAGYDISVANKAAHLIVKHFGSETFLNNVHNALKKEYPNGVEVYGVVKPTLSKYAKELTAKKKKNTKQKAKTNTKKVTSTEKVTKNNEVIKILCKAGYSNEVASYVASTVVKNLGANNIKYITYKTIIMKYGQKKGLEIYNHIKNHIL